MLHSRRLFFYCSFIVLIIFISLTEVGCANVGAPTGGPRDSLAPVLRSATPSLRSVNSTADKITLVFDEYVELLDAQNNVFVSPLQNKSPNINYNLNTVTVKLKDTLQPNTTYSINFGNAIKDINEGNVFRDFIYTFSTGPVIDSLSISGKVIMANTGLVDSTLQVYLYQDAIDTAILFKKPKYLTKLNGKGEFSFTNLPAASFRIYALKDIDGTKNYNSKKEAFAFYPQNISLLTKDSIQPFTLFAFAEEAGAVGSTPTVVTQKATENDRINYIRVANAPSKRQNIYEAANVSFTDRLKPAALLGLSITDTNYNKTNNVTFIQDSLGANISINAPWAKGESYYLIADKNIVEGVNGKKLFKSDTLSFVAMGDADYGRLVVEFKNYDPGKKARFQILNAEKIVLDTIITTKSWSYNRLTPGEYNLRILYDSNGNGIWDPGDFKLLLQPEIVQVLPNKLVIKGDWDNEITVEL